MQVTTVEAIMSKPLAIGAIVLDCPDPGELAEFYATLLGWKVQSDTGGDWVDVVNPAGGPSLAFQRDPEYQAPTWPDPKRPQMLHPMHEEGVLLAHELDRHLQHRLGALMQRLH